MLAIAVLMMGSAGLGAASFVMATWSEQEWPALAALGCAVVTLVAQVAGLLSI